MNRSGLACRSGRLRSVSEKSIVRSSISTLGDHQELRILRRILNVALRKKLPPSNPCAEAGSRLPKRACSGRTTRAGPSSRVPGAERPSQHRPDHRRETVPRVYRGLMPMKKDYVDLEYAIVWIQDSKTANGSLKLPLPRSSEGVGSPVGSRRQSS
jgi:hypothetical protein